MIVSALILTYNEEANLPACLEALAWCDDIVVLDSGSTDLTTSIAHEHGVRVLSRRFDNFANQRNFGIDNGNFCHEWVLHLDADEVVTPAFVSHLQTLKPQPGIFAYQVPSKLMLFGRWLRYAGMYPTYQVRLGHRQRLRFIQVGHGQRENLEPKSIGVFSEPYLHFNFSHGLVRWFEKHIRYAEDEARSLEALRQVTGSLLSGDEISRRRAAKAYAARIPYALRPIARFFYVYFYRAGFRDGAAGLMYALMLSVYEGMIAVFALSLAFRQPRTR